MSGYIKLIETRCPRCGHPMHLTPSGAVKCLHCGFTLHRAL